jgi:short-subunit dehydrogenase
MAKIAIVTGATGGLGQEFIKEIQKIDEIDEIWAVGRNEKKLEELRKKYSIIRPVIADFSTDGVEVIKQKIQKELRANIDDVRFLINNAGIGYMGHFDKQGTEDIEKLCKINCSAPAALMSLCIPLKSCVYDIFYSDGKDERA